jgi:hypothetical protein
VLGDSDGAVSAAYGAGGGGAPVAVLVSTQGTIRGAPAVGIPAIERLVTTALAEEDEPGERWTDGLPLGEPVPSLVVNELDGGEVDLQDTLDGETVILFWRPGCRPCRDLYGRVRAWESEHPAGVPSLLVVSIGNADETSADPFGSPVLLDELLAANDALGAGLAPTAVLVDADGRIASSVAVGADAVMSLLRP